MAENQYAFPTETLSLPSKGLLYPKDSPLSKGTIDILFEIGWIKPSKRLELPGRPSTWVTTNKFLDHFGLSAINQLPGLDELKESGLLNFDNKVFKDPFEQTKLNNND